MGSLEARFGLRIGAALTERSSSAGHDISERLRVAREQALERARLSHHAVVAAAGGTPLVGVSAAGAATLGRQPAWWTRLASALPLITLVLGLFVIDQWHDRAQVNAAADVDTALLSDDLPPDAYSDPGFAEFLKTRRE